MVTKPAVALHCERVPFLFCAHVNKHSSLWRFHRFQTRTVPFC